MTADDAENDTLNFEWNLNGPGATENDMIIATNKNKSDVFLNLDCAKAGSYRLDVTVDDGKDSIVKSGLLTLMIQVPDEPVAIVDFLPQTIQSC